MAKIIIISENPDGTFKRIEREQTMEEKEAIKKQDKEQRAREKARQVNAVPLLCDICGKKMGMVYEFDLNGSRFYHSACMR